MKNQAWVAFDQWINAFFFNGWADETISSRAYRNSAQGKTKWITFERWINRLFFWQPNHCRQSFVAELARLQMPPAYRELYTEKTAGLINASNS